jgi:hypothetical protein
MVVRTKVDVDDVLDHSFPASDPPPWTVDGAETRATPRPAPRAGVAARLRAVGRAFQPLASLLGAAALTLAVPLLVILLPLALMYRLALEVLSWPAWLRLPAAKAERHTRRAATAHVLPGV